MVLYRDVAVTLPIIMTLFSPLAKWLLRVSSAVSAFLSSAIASVGQLASTLSV
ncbi:TPA: hypothetical protein ACY3HR_002305 [Citrobacter freundii]|nr:hypothetical protein [Salmonella enterica subsp. enterica serovar Poona]